MSLQACYSNEPGLNSPVHNSFHHYYSVLNKTHLDFFIFLGFYSWSWMKTVCRNDFWDCLVCERYTTKIYKSYKATSLCLSVFQCRYRNVSAGQ